MSNTIRFLEVMGRGPVLSPLEYTSAVAALDVDDDQRQALLARDHNALNDLLGGRKKMMCLILPAEDEPAPGDDEQQPEEPAEDTPTEQ